MILWNEGIQSLINRLIRSLNYSGFRPRNARYIVTVFLGLQKRRLFIRIVLNIAIQTSDYVRTEFQLLGGREFPCPYIRLFIALSQATYYNLITFILEIQLLDLNKYWCAKEITLTTIFSWVSGYCIRERSSCAYWPVRCRLVSKKN